MFTLIQRNLLQNFQSFTRIRTATIAYQFKIQRPFYYPDRNDEFKRASQKTNLDLVPEKQEHKNLPRDYYYRILGLNRNATTQEIKSTFYMLAKRFHPDANNTPQESKRFQEISNAYHILTDENKRMEYDHLGMIKDEQNFLKSVAHINKVNKTKNGESIVPATRDEILQVNNFEPQLELTFIEAANGTKKNVDLRYLTKCPLCKGKSIKQINRGTNEICRKCGGSGQLIKKMPTFTSVNVCDQCEGKSYIISKKCGTCDNRGIIMDTIKICVNVPPGVNTDDIISTENPKTKHRVNYKVKIKGSDYYRREGKNIHSERFITISEAVLGGTFKVRGINGDVDVKVDPGTESHTKVVVKGKGIKTREGTGDHVITFKIRIPRQLSMKQRQLILALAKTEDPLFQLRA